MPPATANITTSTSSASDSQPSQAYPVDGHNYVLVSNTPSSAAPPTLPPPSENIPVVDSTALCDGNLFEYPFYTGIAIACGDYSTSVDWTHHDRPSIHCPDDACLATCVSSRSDIADLSERPFVLDSCANCHISPERGDFKTLIAIPPVSVRGFSESCVQAVGNRSGRCTTHFDSESCWVTDEAGATIIHGLVSPATSRNLYTVNSTFARVAHSPPTPSALYAARVPDLETWHRRLGHCNMRTIIDMAQSDAVEDMAIDLSLCPPKCGHCVLGKQTSSPVSAVREGVKATRPLERVHVDLVGPMPCVSSSGRLYSMHRDVVDDFTSYVWSLPLRCTDEAASVLQAWQKHVETQSGQKLRILVIDNDELVSKSLNSWCSAHGIDQQLTAASTSANTINGRAKCVHHIVLGKARAMRLACNAPGSFWDEFCATAAYLTTLTATPRLRGKTPFELWFGRRPSLAHLREVGCHAFALIQSNNPNIYRFSTPCILIGYFPKTKAYRLWDTNFGKVFNAFHVTFVEHLDALPSNFRPGTTITLNPGAPPSWDSAIALPSDRPLTDSDVPVRV